MAEEDEIERKRRQREAARRLLEAADKVWLHWFMDDADISSAWDKDAAQLPRKAVCDWLKEVTEALDCVNGLWDKLSIWPPEKAFVLNCEVCNTKEASCEFAASCMAWKAMLEMTKTIYKMLQHLKATLQDIAEKPGKNQED